MTEIEKLKTILQDELMDDYEFDELANALLVRGIRVLPEEEKPDRVRFSSYAHRSILKALVERCIDLCGNGSVDDVLAFAPYVLNVTQNADFEIASPDFAVLPWVEFGADIADMVREQALRDLRSREGQPSNAE